MAMPPAPMLSPPMQHMTMRSAAVMTAVVALPVMLTSIVGGVAMGARGSACRWVGRCRRGRRRGRCGLSRHRTGSAVAVCRCGEVAGLTGGTDELQGAKRHAMGMGGVAGGGRKVVGGVPDGAPPGVGLGRDGYP